MKLKYILPAATIASVAAVVTPLVTSCGEKWDASWKAGQTYKAMTPKDAQEFDDINALTTAYHEDLKANKKIYSDDLVYTYANMEDNDNIIRKISVTTTDVSDKLFDWTTNNEVTKYFKLSFKMSIDAVVSIGGVSLDYQNRSGVLKDIPLSLDYDEDGAYFVFNSGAFGEYASWEVTMPELIIEMEGGKPKSIKLGDKNFTYNEDYRKNHLDEFNTVIRRVIGYMCIGDEPSNYYSKMTVKEPE